MQTKKNEDKNEIYKSIAPYLNLGIRMAVTIAAFALLGWWLDDKYNMAPTLTLIFSILGIGIAMFNFIRTTLKE